MSRTDYDVLVIGGGAAGLTASGMSAALGARTVLVEANRLGGDCTWTGCVPSKALIKAAGMAHGMRTADRYGFRGVEPDFAFSEVMGKVRAVRQGIYDEADSPDRLRERNVELVTGLARFLDDRTVAIESDMGERHLTSRYFIICTGSRPKVPAIPNVRPEDLLTNESLFELNELPRRLLVLGGGPVGLEMAQAFSRLGSRVRIIEQAGEILAGHEPECSAIVRNGLVREGIGISLESTIDDVEVLDDGYRAEIGSGREDRRWESFSFDKILVATGRRPNVSGLNLDRAGVDYDDEGIVIDGSCRTSNGHIYACGDVAHGPNFTHAAEEMARTAVTRLLFKIPVSYERNALPGVTFTDPESARVGKTKQELTDEGVAHETIRLPYRRIDRAAIEQATEGVILLHVSPVVGRLLGAHVVGQRAGEVIDEFALAMKARLPLRKISESIHAYPTYLHGAKRAADLWYVRNVPGFLIPLLKRLFRYRGQVPEDRTRQFS